MATVSSQLEPPSKQAPWLAPMRTLRLRALRALLRRAQVRAQAQALRALLLRAPVRAEVQPNDLRRRWEDPRREQQDVRPYPASVWEPKRRAWRPAREFFAKPALEVEGLPATVQALWSLSQRMGPKAPGFVFLKQAPGLS